jgi:iron complex outermembrane receptor protein
VNVRSRRCLLLSIFCAFLSVQAFAQSTGSLQGTVTDSTGGVVQNVTIVVTNGATQAAKTVTTDAAGKFSVSPLDPGTYVVMASARGFRSAAAGPATVKAGETVSVDVNLSVLSAVEHVDVTAPAERATDYQVPTTSIGPLGDKNDVDIPFSVTTIPGYLFDSQQARNFSDVVKYLPSAQIEARGGIDVGRPQTRGFEGGVAQNSRMDGLNITATTAYPMEPYDRLEVLSGLAGAMYGPAAPAGVFNLVMKRPTDAPTLQVGVSYDSRALPTVQGDIGGRVGSKGIFGYRLIALYGDGTGYAEQSNRHRELVSGAFDIHLGERTVVEINASHYRFKQTGFPASFSYGSGHSTQLPEAPDASRAGYGQPFAGMDLVTNTGSLRVKHELSKDWHLTVGVLDQAAKRPFYNATDQMTDDVGDFRVSVTQSYNNWVITSNLLYLNGHIRTGTISHDVVIGTNGYYQRNYGGKVSTTWALGNSTLANPVIFGAPSWTGTWATYRSSGAWQQAFIVGDTISFAKRWSALLTGSMNWINSRNYTANSSGGYTETGIYEKSGFSPAASLMYKPADRMSVYVTYANSLQQGDTTPTTGVANPGEVLPPYRSKEVEVGYKVVVSRVEFPAAAFHMTRAFAFTDPIDNVYKVEGEQVNNGLELMARGSLMSDLSVYGGLTWLDPRLQDTGKAATTNKLVVGVPKIQANLLAEYQVRRFSGLAFNANLHGTGRRAGNDSNLTWADGYTTVDIGVRYTRPMGSAAVTWRVGVSNLTNTHYWASIFPGSINGSASSYSTFLGAARMISAMMQIGFGNGPNGTH